MDQFTGSRPTLLTGPARCETCGSGLTIRTGKSVTKLIFLDETWAKTNMTRLYDRRPRGKRLLGAAPYGHWKTTFLAGLCHGGIVAPLVLDGPINGKAFLAWVKRFLAPILQPNQIVTPISWAATRSPACARQSRYVAQPSCSCLPTLTT